MTPNEILERAQWLVKAQDSRVRLQEELQKVFHLEFDEAVVATKPAAWVKEMKDPQPFNSMQWLVDVLAHEEPTIKITVPQGALPQQLPPMAPPMMPPSPTGGPMAGMDPMMMQQMGIGGSSMLPGIPGGQFPQEATPGPAEEQALTAAAEMGDKLERMAKEIFRQNDQRAATSLQRDELYAAFVNGMVVNKVADLRYNAARWDKYARSRPGASPFYIRALNPAHVYFEYDDYGVCEVLHRYLRPLREVVRVYGVGAPGLANVKPDDANGYVLFSEYWTDELSAKWIEQVYMYGEDANYVQGVMSAGESVRGYFVEEPIKNEFGFIPYVVRVARGSSIFSRTNMVYPHLYSGHKSKLFLRNNLFLTMASTLAFMLVNPQVVHESENGETTIEFDFSKPNAYAIRKGEKITPVELKITQDFYNVMTQFGEMMEESTVSKVVAGQSPGGVTAAAGINLLIGGGKLTVSPVQAALGEVRQGAIANVFDYVRSFPRLGEGASALSMYLGGELAELDPASLPDFMDINVKYNAFLPQDKALAVQTWLTPLMQKLISSDYFYEQVGVQDVGTMRKQIDEDITRMIPEDQLQAGQPPPEQLGAGAPEGVPGQTGTQAQETVVNQPTQNPMEQTQNPANALNDLYNSIQSPMQAAQ